MNYIKGMDISSYREMLDKGYEYFDEFGNTVDILDYAVEKGFNYARIRIWNNPSNIPESGGYCSLDKTIKLAKRIKEIGIPYLLDFHYSDWWADPGNQNKPKDWEYLHGRELMTAVYKYTKDVLDTLADNDVSPSMVQVGNEIRCGMLWPDGSSEDFRTLAKLINAGIKGVRESKCGKAIQIMLHLDQGGRYHYYENWFDAVMRNGVEDFDIIGLSYYPFWHGTYQDLDETLNKLEERYHKDLIIAEVAYAHKLGDDSLFGKGQERLGGLPASEDGQYEALKIISGIINGVNNNRGKGFFYWEPFMRADNPSAWGYCMGIVDSEGKPLKTLTMMNSSFPIRADEARSLYSKLRYSDDCSEPINGTNILCDSGFTNDLSNWNYTEPNNVNYEIESIDDVETFSFQSKGNVCFKLHKIVTIKETGDYSLAVEYKGDNTTGVCVKPYIELADYRREINIYPSDKIWTRGTIDIYLDAGTKVDAGIEIDSPEIKGQIRNIGLYLRS